MALRRGFKSEAERIARRVRVELGLGATESATPEMLADLLGIEVRAGDELIPRERFDELERMQPGSFSACTIPALSWSRGRRIQPSLSQVSPAERPRA